jgi:hypothetical protein
MSAEPTSFLVHDWAGLHAALAAIAGGDGSYAITLDIPAGTLTLEHDLPAIALAAGGHLTLAGQGATLDGAGGHRGLMVLSGGVEIADLTIANATARGGQGGDGLFGGGGGGGLGGGLFVGAAGDVTLRNVDFTANAAIGGDGGDGLGTGAGGGGGMGGHGGDGSGDPLAWGGDDATGFGGGGGLGTGADGGSLAGTATGRDGIARGAAAGGRGSDYQPGGANGGGGGAGRLAHFLSMAGGGGIGGGDGAKAPEGGWGAGGFGGGGGGTPGSYGGTQGGFGGGAGGSYLAGGQGGFGGGGGGSALGGGTPGFGAGAGGTSLLGAGGGGGLGAGGAIFVQAGGSLAFLGGGIAGGQVAGGAGGQGAGGGHDGDALASGIYLHGGQTLTLGSFAGAPLTIADVIAGGIPGAEAGLVIAAGGTVALTAANSYTGGVVIETGAELRLGHAQAAGTGPIAFAAGAQSRLVIDGTDAPPGVLRGLSATTEIVLRALAPTATATLAGHTLHVSDATHAIALNLDPALDLSGLQLTLATDPGGGIRIAFAGLPETGLPCFRHGTLIATPRGEIPVEALCSGDLVLTRGGHARPIRWIGRRDIAGTDVADRPELRPVLIRRGALGPDLPRRDLQVSPLHAVLAFGVLVPAAALVNGISVLRAAEAPTGLQYSHIELHDQALILAEGAPAETFLDEHSRAMFDNAASFAALDTDPAHRPAAIPIPRVTEGWRLEAVRRRIAARAGLAAPTRPSPRLAFHLDRRDATCIEGWAYDPACPGIPVALELHAGGAVLAQALANRYRPDLDRAGLAGGSCAFSIALPPGLDPAALRLLRARDGTVLCG